MNTTQKQLLSIVIKNKKPMLVKDKTRSKQETCRSTAIR